MKILFCGDIVGEAGRITIAKYIPILKNKLNIDCVIANAENCSHGFGITPKSYQEIIKSGVDIITLGNHAFDKPNITDILNKQSNIVRPLNYKEKVEGAGYCLSYIKGARILTVNIIGNVFMGDRYSCPFTAISEFLEDFKLKANADIIVVDCHAEAVSEKTALAMMVDGKVSAFLGTHTHTPTMDGRVLKNGTAYQTDVGMCGDYDSVIGMKYETSIVKFIGHKAGEEHKNKRLEPATGEGTLSAVLIDIDVKSGMAKSIEPIILGPNLKNTI